MQAGARRWLALSVIAAVFAVAVGDYIGVPAKVVLFGVWGAFFCATFNAGLSGLPVAGPRLDVSGGVLAGFAYAGLGVFVLGPAFLLVMSHAEDLREARRASLLARLAEVERLEDRDEDDDPSQDDSYFDRRASFVHADGTVGPVRGDEVVTVRRIGGGWVLVDPGRESVRDYPEGWRPGDPDPWPTAEQDDALPATSGNLSRALIDLDDKVAFEFLGRSSPWSFKLTLASLLLVFGFWLAPASLSLAALGKPGDVLNVVQAASMAARGGAQYLLIVFVGFMVTVAPAALMVMSGTRPDALLAVLLVGAAQAAYRMGSVLAHDGLVLATLVSVGALYIIPVLGLWMGQLVADRPELHLESDA